MFLNRNLLSGYCVNAGAAAVLLILATACGPQGESQATSSEQERAGDIANPGAHRTQLPQTEQLDEFSLREGVKIPHSADWVRLGQLGGRVMSLKRGDAQVIFEVDRHDNHRKALERMRSAARELPVVARYSEISGYPVLYRSVIVPAPISEYARESKDTQLYETTLVLIADSVVLEAQARGPVEQGTVTETALAKMIEGIALPANPDTAADLEWLNQAAADDHAELQQARVPLEAPAVFTPHTAEAALAPVGAAQQFAARSEPDVDGEVEVAVDSSGRHMVLANNGEFPVDLTISNNYGFPGSFTDCGTGDPLCSITNQGGPNPTGGGGDPSVAVGASGTFYVASIAQPPGGPGPLPNPACGSMIYASTANASGDITGFSFQAIAAASQTLFADQEHLAADPINSAPGGGDLLYSVYRQFNSCTNPISGQGPFITCSADSGLTWATPVAIGTGDFPRVSVAPNGNALVAYTSGGTIRMARFGQCTPSATPGGLPTIAPIGIPTIVDAAAPVLDCTTGSTPTSTGTAIPGLDRCNVGNDLRSPVAVADPTNSNNVFVIHAEQSAGNAANDNVILTGIDVTGANPPQNFTLNSAAGGHRFMPWLCATGSQVFASWYDMRAANAANNSRLDYFGRSLSVNAGVFTLNPEFQINDVQDSTCATAFPSGVLAVGAGQATSTDECPGSQQAGFCTDTNGAQIYGQCDFSDCGSPLTNNTIVNNPCTCPLDPVVNDGTTRTTCQGRRGEPKYGDYNGNACSGGRLYAAWAAGNPVDVDVMFKCSTNPNNVTATPYVDVTPPVIDVATVPPAQPLSNCQALPLSKPKALDVCGDPSPSISALVSGNPVDLNTFVFPPGPTTINWSAVDVEANVSAPGPATLVTVTDTTSPEFVVPADIVSDSCVVTLSVPTATDACAGSEPVTAVISSLNPNVGIDIPAMASSVQVVLPPGSSNIDWTTSDGSNTSTLTQHVKVAHPYIRELGNGDIEYSITFNAHQAYVEVFVKQNGVQNISGNIVSSEVHNANGTFSYRRVAPAAQYHAGDTISARFYSYKPNSPGVFTPGPQEQIWLPPYFYGTGIDCAPGCHPYIKALPNGSLEFSVTFSQLQSDVQAVIRRNGTQITSGSIISNGVVRNSNGSFTYRRVLAANQFALNDRVSVRFSGVVQGQPTVFVPGPTSGMWSSDFIFGAAPDPNCLVPPAPGTCIEDALPRSAAVASSQESSTLGAGKAIDGNFSTRWSSAFSNPQWIYVDLGQARHISRVDLTWETAASADYDIQVAADGTNGAGPWATIFTDPAGNGGFDAITNLNVTARYVRMFSRKRTTQYGNSLWEFEVFGDLNPGCTP